MAEKPQEPVGPPESFAFQKFAGIKNTVSSERLSPEELELAKNIDIDDAGQIHRRRGYVKVASGNYHSLFRSTRKIYAVKNNDLGMINDDNSFTVLKSGVGWERLSYVEVDGKIYFSSLSSSGVIDKDQVVRPWGQVDSQGYWYSPVVNPTQYLNPIAGTYLHDPPMAQVITYWNGRIYLAQGKDLWFTELYLYDSVDRTSNFFQFENDITVIGAVTDGMYVGTTTDVWFMSGKTINERRREPVITYGALPGSLLSVPEELLGLENSASSKNAVLFMTDSGLFAGLDGGICYNLTQNRVLFPDAASVAAMFRRQDGINQYVGVLDSQGSPASAARIGDYVDVEIRRFRGA